MCSNNGSASNADRGAQSAAPEAGALPIPEIEPQRSQRTQRFQTVVLSHDLLSYRTSLLQLHSDQMRAGTILKDHRTRLASQPLFSHPLISSALFSEENSAFVDNFSETGSLHFLSRCFNTRHSHSACDVSRRYVHCEMQSRRNEIA